MALFVKQFRVYVKKNGGLNQGARQGLNGPRWPKMAIWYFWVGQVFWLT
jgi:hypothetical protein